MTDSAQWATEHGGGARRSLPGEGTGMSGVVELAEQLAVAVKALRDIAGSDAVDNALDPDRNRRIAGEALGRLTL